MNPEVMGTLVGLGAMIAFMAAVYVIDAVRSMRK